MIKLNTNQGTHVLVSQNGNYLKKHWCKIGYVTLKPNGEYYLHDASCFGNSKKNRLSKPWQYSSVFHTSAIVGIHFDWIYDSVIYDNQGNVIK